MDALSRRSTCASVRTSSLSRKIFIVASCREEQYAQFYPVHFYVNLKVSEIIKKRDFHIMP
jgi:hypothetical protein